MQNRRESNRKERATAEMNRAISRYDQECGPVHKYKLAPEELKNYRPGQKIFAEGEQK